MKMTFTPLSTDNGQIASTAFLFLLCSALLLALKENGILNDMQNRHAQEALLLQKNNRKALFEVNNTDA